MPCRSQRWNNDLSPLASWLFDGDLLDSSGNGYGLSLDQGSTRFCVSGLIPDDGVDRGLAIEVLTGNNRFTRALTAALQITGSLTVQALVWPKQWDTGSQIIVESSASTESEADNYLYQVGVATGGNIFNFWEYGTGSNESSGSGSSYNVSQSWQVVTARRTDNGDGTSDTNYWWNDKKVATFTGENTPTGGTNTTLRVFGGRENARYFNGLCAGLQIYDRALTDAEVYAQVARVIPRYVEQEF
jgi:hypothetical protein